MPYVFVIFLFLSLDQCIVGLLLTCEAACIVSYARQHVLLCVEMMCGETFAPLASFVLSSCMCMWQIVFSISQQGLGPRHTGFCVSRSCLRCCLLSFVVTTKVLIVWLSTDCPPPPPTPTPSPPPCQLFKTKTAFSFHLTTPETYALSFCRFIIFIC